MSAIMVLGVLNKTGNTRQYTRRNWHLLGLIIMLLYQHRVDENSGIHVYTHSICLLERFCEVRDLCYSRELE